MLYAIYSGQLFFAAAALFVAAAVFDISPCRDRRPVARRIAGFLALLSIPLAALSGTPVPLLLAIPTVTLTTAYVVMGFGPRRRGVMAGAAIALCLLAVAWELPYHLRSPHVAIPSQLFVIGDSLSSGGFGEVTPWPDRLAREARVPTTNLAQPSDDTTGASVHQVPQLPEIADSSHCVIIEIGGNDMLDGRPIEQFAHALDRLISAAGATGRRRVIMLELPLLPGRWRYGAVQRRLAAKHRIVLVPKRVMARVLLRKENTFDGIHLTQRGHDALAREMAAWLDWRTHRAPLSSSAGCRSARTRAS
ncbi:MAG TPA: GDSL-type esterase/lipase family protein, partial [Thermoanaerobaculia bacterium]